MGLREQIFASKLPREQVHVPEWDCDVWVKRMTVRELLAFEQRFEGDGDKRSYLVWLVIHTVCDDSGQLLFGADDFDRLQETSPSALLRLEPIATRLNVLSREDRDQLEKKSSNVQVSGSPIASP